MDTSSPTLTPPPNQAPISMEQPTSTSSSSPSKLIGLVVVLVLVIAGVFAFIRMRNSQPVMEQQTPTVGQEELPTEETETLDAPTPAPITEVTLKAPVANAVVQSPLFVSGVVPPGWMFEGAIGMEIQDENKQVITQAPGTEVQQGYWQRGEPVEFRGELTFTTNSPTGFLVIKKDNPSGLPENDGSFSIPIKFE